MRPAPLVIPMLLAAIHPASGCLWDHDTLVAENARFPGMQSILTGNFPRHSKEFYEWRKTQSEKAIAANPRMLPPYDDLAVAQHKLGDHEGAIETMKRKDALQPGIYETYSNMGTFLIYTGDLPKALWCINRALEINPNAHFGREQYQKWLIEWVMAGGGSEIERNDTGLDFEPMGYAAFILSKQPITARKKMTEALRLEAIRGVLGMMRFADYDNPLLQEALGDLLMTGIAQENATLHATVAYTQAAAKTDNADRKKLLLGKASIASSTTIREKRTDMPNLDKEVEAGRKLNATIRTEEMGWIAAGVDASAAFQRKYLNP